MTGSNSLLVCWRDGIPVYGHRNGWRHALGGRTGAIPPGKRHYPVPVLRTAYEEALSVTVTRERFWEISAECNALDEKMQREHPKRARKKAAP